MNNFEQYTYEINPETGVVKIYGWTHTYSTAYLVVIALCLFIAIEVITMQTLNATLLRAVTVLLPLI